MVGNPNIVRYAETGEALVSSVNKIIFVGSPGVGKMVSYSMAVIINFLLPHTIWMSQSLLY